MEVLFKCMAALLLASTACADSISEELYYRAPKLFHMDDYQRCLYEGATYCKGVFELWPEGPNDLYDELKSLKESNRYLLNRTLLHRAICLNFCDRQEHEPPAEWFERCVDRSMHQYGLRARMQRLHYCKSKDNPGTRPVDWIDLLVAALIIIILLLNVVGTIYDLIRNPDKKPNRFLIIWSLRDNWNRLVAHKTGDERLDALAPIHAIKAHQIGMVVFAHTHQAMLMLHHADDRQTDEMLTGVFAILFRNGTIVVQTFVTLSSFLLGYMLLLHAEKNERKLSLRDAPAIILSRFLRMTPTLMLVIAVMATWVARTADGPLWTFMEQLEADCRAKWWTHLLYVNNMVNPDQRCGIQTWFLAVDMQVFVVLVVLALLLLRNPQRAPKVLAAVYACVVATNIALNIKWEIVGMSYWTTGDNMRNLLTGLKSYNWMFVAPWTSLPAGLHGLILAFVHYNLQKIGFKPITVKWLRVVAWLPYPLMIVWPWNGVLMLGVENRLALAVHAAVNRIVFNAMVTFTLWVFFNRLSGWVPKYLSWRGFHIVSRLALSCFLVHWLVTLGAHAVRTQPLEFTAYFFLTSWITDLVMTLVLALLLNLLVEQPSQRLVDWLL